MVHTEIGSVQTINGKDFVRTDRGQRGFALFGPYVEYAPGSYSVAFEFQRGRFESSNQEISCVVDVVTDCGETVLATTSLTGERLKESGGSVELDFTLEETKFLECRVYATGLEPITVACDREVKRSSNSRFWLPPSMTTAAYDPVFRDNSKRFARLYDIGAKIVPTQNGTLVDYFGLQLLVKHTEDFFLIEEIFLSNVYNFNTPKNVAVVDIGMNVGFSSLYFARMPSVREVHSFEPFPAPFARALENFDLNPELRAKIRANKFGLSDKNETLSVPYSDGGTISTSIRGNRSGDLQRIEIRDAGLVFADIIASAEAKGLDVMVKMDCEGCEFPIFERLESLDLIAKVRIFVIEWHKWWSVDKTQNDLIRPLLASGFDVLDHNSVLNKDAAMLYAIRSRR